jgi:anthranilate phosphoribosyltransferase
MIDSALKTLAAGRHLTEAEARAAFERIMSGQAGPALIGALLTALAIRGETEEEIAGAAAAMRAAAVRVDPGPGPVVDTCGTGGDGSRTFNISTAAAVVVAAAGVKVAKHGNRSITSLCGSADVLEALGVKIDAAPAAVERCIREARIGFLFAPAFHPAMKHAGPVRRELGIRTVFNILGPLTNPAGADRQVIGVPRPELTRTTAAVLARLGSRRAMVVHSADGLDEISVGAPTTVTELSAGSIRTFELDPAELGLARAGKAALTVGSKDESAAAIREVLAGRPGPRRDVVLLNAAAALLVADAVADWAEGLAAAARAVDSGAAAGTLERWAALSRDS